MGPVLSCVDDSEGARRALRVAHELATGLGVDLVLLHVEPPTATPGIGAAPAGRERLLEEELAEGEALVRRLAREAGIEVARHRVVVGPAASSIVATCEEEGAGLVVLGSRGRGGLTSALLGSVSSEVAASAPCPCVIVSPAATTTGSVRPG